MNLSKADFIDSYVTEIKEHLETINNSILILKSSPHNIPVIKEILRQLHTIKGASRMLSFSNIEKLSHALEDVYKGILEEKYQHTTNITKLTYEIGDIIERLLLQIQKKQSDEYDISACLETCNYAAQGFFFDPADISKAPDNSEYIEEDPYIGINESFETITSVRIELDKIDSIIQSFDNLISRQFRIKHQIELLEEKIDGEIPNQIKEDLNNTAEALFETQKNIFILRMLPLEIIMAPLRKETEITAISLGKDVIIDIPKTTFMLDKIILEQLRTIILHLIRNSLDHGIENSEERKSQEKDPKGKISITASQLSNKIIIAVKDDGRGLQYDKIREKAEKAFPHKKEEIRDMSDKDLQQFLYNTGFSTTDQTTELSGRGMGLEIVRTCMEKIKGKIKIDTEKGKGTSFELSIPLTLATQRGFFVYASGAKVMIPSHYVKEILNITEDKITTMQSQRYISYNNKLIPLYYLSTVLEVEKPEHISSVLILEYLETQIGIIVDSIRQNENVISCPLPEILKNVKSLQGVVYDETYSIVPILDIPSVMQKMRELVVYDFKKYETKNKKQIKKILIVDDSSTTRQIEQTIFETEGYLTDTAADGVEALDKLKKIHFDAVVTDISMPRMDGDTLLINMRRMNEYENTPVIVVSGAYDPIEKQKFLKEGAQAFIVKSEFQRGNLLQALKELLSEK